MEYQLIRSRRRTLALQLKPDGSVLVRAPLRAPKWQIEAFLRQHWDWVERRRAKQAALPQPERLTEEELADLKKRARRVFLARAAYYAPVVGVSYSRITVRSQRTKWGRGAGLRGGPRALPPTGDEPLPPLLGGGGAGAAGLCGSPEMAAAERREPAGTLAGVKI